MKTTPNMNLYYRKQPSPACDAAVMQAAARHIGVELRYWNRRRLRRTLRLGAAAGIAVMVLLCLYWAGTPRTATHAELREAWGWEGFEAQSRALSASLADLRQEGN